MKMLYQKIKKAKTIIALICLAVGGMSCNNDSSKGKEHDPSKPIVVGSFEPSEGRVRDYVLIKGSNFGYDKSAIKVFFNKSEAKILGVNESGTTILVLVERVPFPNGDGEAEVFVEIGGKTGMAPGLFKYKVSASVTTLAGNGSNGNSYASGKLSDLLLSGPTYIGVDYNYNVFFCVGDSPAGTSALLLISEEKNTVRVVAHVNEGFDHRGVPNLHPVTGQMILGGERDRDRHIIINPDKDFSMEVKYIKQWDANGFPMPTFANYNSITTNYGHYNIVYCEWDGFLYTRYWGGQIVRIDPEAWTAKIIGMTPPGVTYGMGFNTYTDRDEEGNRINLFTDTDMRYELWMAYSADGGSTDAYAPTYVRHTLSTVDIRDELTWLQAYGEDTPVIPVGASSDIMSSFKLRLGTGTGSSGHRDGPMNQALINNPRQISFDQYGVIYEGDRGSNTIRQIDTKTEMVTTLIGIPGISSPFKDGAKEDATFNAPHGIVTNREGNILYVADNANHRIRRIAVE